MVLDTIIDSKVKTSGAELIFQNFGRVIFEDYKIKFASEPLDDGSVVSTIKSILKENDFSSVHLKLRRDFGNFESYEHLNFILDNYPELHVSVTTGNPVNELLVDVDPKVYFSPFFVEPDFLSRVPIKKEFPSSRDFEVSPEISPLLSAKRVYENNLENLLLNVCGFSSEFNGWEKSRFTSLEKKLINSEANVSDVMSFIFENPKFTSIAMDYAKLNFGFFGNLKSFDSFFKNKIKSSLSSLLESRDVFLQEVDDYVSDGHLVRYVVDPSSGNLNFLCSGISEIKIKGYGPYELDHFGNAIKVYDKNNSASRVFSHIRKVYESAFNLNLGKKRVSGNSQFPIIPELMNYFLSQRRVEVTRDAISSLEKLIGNNFDFDVLSESSVVDGQISMFSSYDFLSEKSKNFLSVVVKDMVLDLKHHFTDLESVLGSAKRYFLDKLFSDATLRYPRRERKPLVSGETFFDKMSFYYNRHELSVLNQVIKLISSGSTFDAINVIENGRTVIPYLKASDLLRKSNIGNYSSVRDSILGRVFIYDSFDAADPLKFSKLLEKDTEERIYCVVGDSVTTFFSENYLFVPEKVVKKLMPDFGWYQKRYDKIFMPFKKLYHDNSPNQKLNQFEV